MRKLNIMLASLLLITIAIVSCKKKETVTPTTNGSGEQTVTVASLNNDTLGIGYSKPGTAQFLKGTLVANTTYYLAGNIYVPKGDTLTVQPGVTVICLGNSNTQASGYNITIRGVINSVGTQTSPIAFTVPTTAKSINNGEGGAWGGFDCDSADAVILKWTKIEYSGGPDASGGPRLGVSCKYSQSLDMEDSWIRFTYDDGLRIHGVKNVILRRNTFEHCGASNNGGESINIKQGATGDISYNIIWNSATKAIKLETDATVSFPQTSFNIYNNTCINTGFRNNAKPGPGTSIDLNTWANVWNNLYINCLRGVAIWSGADIADTRYNYNGFFCTNTAVDSTGDPGAPYFTERLDYEFYSGYLPQFPATATTGGDQGFVGVPQKHDVFMTTTPASSQNVVVKMNEYTTDIPMVDWEVNGGSSPYNVTLASGSPAIGAGIAAIPSEFTNASGQESTSQWPTYVDQGGAGTPITPTPSADLGAKPTSGTYGNLH